MCTAGARIPGWGRLVCGLLTKPTAGVYCLEGTGIRQLSVTSVAVSTVDMTQHCIELIESLIPLSLALP